MMSGSHVLNEVAYPLEAQAAMKLSRFVREGYGRQHAATLAFKFPDYWTWLYGSRGRSFILEDDERIVAHVGCIPFAAKQDGRPVSGTWSVDTFVLPEYRKKGHGTRLQAAAQASCPVFASLWMSPANSRIKLSIGQEIVASLDVLRRGNQGRPQRQRRWQAGPPVPLDIANAAEQYLRDWSFFIGRSAAYCAWRFNDQPGAGYCQVRCDQGLALTRRCGPHRSGDGMVGDAFPADASKETLAELLEAACDHLFGEGCTSVRFGCADVDAVDVLRERSWVAAERMHLHVPQGSVWGRVFVSLSDQDIDQYPW